MGSIISFIAEHMGYLWQGARFRIVGSEVSTSNGGDAVLVLESDILRLRFTRDKTQLFLHLQPLTGDHKWFSIDVVRRHFTGIAERSSLLDISFAEFLRDGMEQIEQRFSSTEWPATRRELHRIEVARAKELFG